MKETNLDFDGLAGNGVNRSGDKWSGNQSGLKMKENFGRKEIRGGLNHSNPDHGKPVTKDAFRNAPTTAKEGKINGGASVKCPSNPDKINVGNK